MFFYTVNNLTMNEKPAVNKIHISAGFGGSPTADSRFAVPCPTGQERAPKSAPTTCTNRYRQFE